MSIFLILFFVSLSGIFFMIGRKLFLLKKGRIDNEINNENGEEVVFNIINLEKIKIFTTKNIRKISYITLVYTIKFYIISSKFLKYKYEKLREKIKNHLYKNKLENKNLEKQEVSKFLKMIGEYKTKIKRIKQKIKEKEKFEN